MTHRRRHPLPPPPTDFPNWIGRCSDQISCGNPGGGGRRPWQGDRMELRRVCVFCGSSLGARPDYVDAARALGYEVHAMLSYNLLLDPAGSSVFVSVRGEGGSYSLFETSQRQMQVEATAAKRGEHSIAEEVHARETVDDSAVEVEERRSFRAPRSGTHPFERRRRGDPDRLVVMGGSAGGFTVLNVVADHPGLCAAAVDLYGVADLFDLDETTHRFEAHYLHSLVGPLPEAAERYRDRSPVNLASSIRTPLLILQGDADQVVPPAQTQAIADRLRSLGRVVELHLNEGEGHGWGRPETVIDELGRTESFLRRHVLRWRTAAKEEI